MQGVTQKKIFEIHSWGYLRGIFTHIETYKNMKNNKISNLEEFSTLSTATILNFVGPELTGWRKIRLGSETDQPQFKLKEVQPSMEL